METGNLPISCLCSFLFVTDFLSFILCLKSGDDWIPSFFTFGDFFLKKNYLTISCVYNEFWFCSSTFLYHPVTPINLHFSLHGLILFCDSFRFMRVLCGCFGLELCIGVWRGHQREHTRGQWHPHPLNLFISKMVQHWASRIPPPSLFARWWAHSCAPQCSHS